MGKSGLFSGIIQWFNSKLGYGFVRDDSSKDDVFINIRNLKQDSYKPQKGDRIKYDKQYTDRGYQATDIEPK